MPTSTLFGYTIEEHDGKLVITVTGAFADAAVHHLREELKAGRGMYVISRLSPMMPLGRLISNRLHEEAYEVQLSTDKLLSQGVDEDLSTFEKQMREFRKSLGKIEDEEPTGATQGKRRPGTIRSKRSKRSKRRPRATQGKRRTGATQAATEKKE